MQCQFNEMDLENWAQFSADRNPVHFDADFAIANGHSGRIVHGMLAMMPLKNHLANEATEGDQPSEIKLHLKHAIGLHQQISYTTAPPQRLKVSADSKTLYSGSAKPRIDPDILTGIAPERKRPILERFSAQALHEKHALLQRTIDSEVHPAVFWDAILFSIYIEDNRKTALASDVQRFLASEGISEHQPYVVYQISHTLSLIQAQWQALDGQDFESIHYSVKGKDLVRVNDSIFGSVVFMLYCHDQPLLAVEMGLIANLLEQQT
ncbi:MaoC/PaaZ C-terminal domain-containing protein [Metapseudomonas boanensis]|uniref:MaoC-like domain-containing protein n=1 Tax=Metapseudomonas boanensis TaxID=2822138 RepID=A0ABS5XFW7_9GAMM|nr:MaoC/PaaZ C-terminal domain-containing protein [Pseudomonas boanensis]MBT8766584.1 hypothetical protein [Pseudomonas boanensis]